MYMPSRKGINPKRVSITITLPPDLMDYLKSKVESREFANIAHGVELCVLRYKESEEGQK